jgi:hypothetical protein
MQPGGEGLFIESRLSRLPGVKGGIMKRLAILTAPVAIVLLVLGPLSADGGELDSHFAVGPSLTSLGEIRTVVERFDAILGILNSYFEAFGADVRGSVAPIGSIGGGISVTAGQRYWLLPGFGVGAVVAFAQCRDGTSGVYESRSGSTLTPYPVNIRVDGRLLDAALDLQAVLLNAGVRIGAGIRLGYYFGRLDVVSVLEIPDEYPDQLAGIPPEVDDRFTGGAFGGEFAITLSVPIASWLTVRGEAVYRIVPMQLTNEIGDQLDFDGNGIPERISFGGLVFRVGVCLRLDLSSEGWEGVME